MDSFLADCVNMGSFHVISICIFQLLLTILLSHNRECDDTAPKKCFEKRGTLRLTNGRKIYLFCPFNNFDSFPARLVILLRFVKNNPPNT